MRLYAFLLAMSAVSLVGADGDFDGRWNIEVPKEARKRVWWLEVTGAGTGQVKGRFVGSPGGDMNDIPEIAVKDGELRFAFNKAYSRKGGPNQKGVYTAKVVKGELIGKFMVEGKAATELMFTGHRAPAIKDKDNGKWKAGKPVALFNGKDLAGWSPMIPGQALGWAVKDGIMVNQARTNNLVSDHKFWNFKLHAEFRIGKGSNGGFGLRGRYEIQIVDDFGDAPDTHGTGALYSRIKPSKNASKAPGEWNIYDVTLIGRQVTVVVNGETVIKKGEVEGLTAMAHDWNEALPGPISVQGDHGQVEIRKLVITPLVQ